MPDNNLSSSSKKMKHSKFRNTGILFEILTRQITADILAGKDDSTAKDLMFKYFKENTELGKEYKLYSFLVGQKVKDVNRAERLLSIITEQRKKLNNKKLLEEKYNLIKEIKNAYPIEDFLKTNIKNYKILASIYKLFEDSSSSDCKFDVNEIYQSKTCIVENIVVNPSVKTPEEETMEFYRSQNENVRLLAYKLMVENVNKKYKNLDDSQKEVLKEYINNISNAKKLSNFIHGKVKSVINELNELSDGITDNEVVKIKINEVVKQLSKITSSTVVKDRHVTITMLGMELLKEIKKQINQ